MKLTISRCSEDDHVLFFSETGSVVFLSVKDMLENMEETTYRESNRSTSSSFSVTVSLHQNTKKKKGFNTIPYNSMNGIGLIFKTSAISLSSHFPPDAMWNDFPPSLLALASSSSDPTA